MSDTTMAEVGAVLGRIRVEMRGSMAIILRPDQEPFAVDSAPGAAQTPAWDAALRKVTARWALWHELERSDPAILVDDAFVLAEWLARGAARGLASWR